MPATGKSCHQMILCVTEKASVAEAASRILGGSAVQKTKLGRWNSEYRFRRPFHGSPHEFVFINARGHVADYDFPNGYGWGECDPRSLLDAPLVASLDRTFRAIARKYVQLCDTLLLFLDGDREGEAIAWEVVEAFAAESGTRRLDIRPSALPKIGVLCPQAAKNIISAGSGDTSVGKDSIVSVLRADFASLNQEALEEALQTLRPINTKVVDAIALRRQLDLRVGFSMTRLQTELLRAAEKVAGEERPLSGPRSPQQRGHAKSRSQPSWSTNVYSYGPCQIPALGLVWLGEGLSYVDRRNVRSMEERPRLQLTSREGHAFQYLGPAQQGPQEGVKAQEGTKAVVPSSLANAPLTAAASPESSLVIDIDTSASAIDSGSSTQEEEFLQQTAGPQPDQVEPGPALTPSLAADLAVRVSQELRQNPFLRVDLVMSRRFTQSRPQPLATVDLQRAMASKYTGKATLAAAESLYLQGIISYPRTETKRYEESREYFSRLLDSLTRRDSAGSDLSGCAETGELASLLSIACSLRSKFNLPPSTSRRSDRAHPPIHPLKLCTQFSTQITMDVYCYVLRHFLATLSDDCVKERVDVRATAFGRVYSTQTVQIIDPGYLSVLYGVTSPRSQLPRSFSGEGRKAEDPGYKKGSLVEIVEVSVLGEETSYDTSDVPSGPDSAQEGHALVPFAPPPTEKLLLGAMDKYNIGTDATMADHIEMIKQRDYVKEEGGPRRWRRRRRFSRPRASRASRASTVPDSPIKNSRQLSVLDAGRRVIRLFLGTGHGATVVSALGRACTEVGMRCICDGVLEPQRVLGDSMAFARYLYDRTLQGAENAGLVALCPKRVGQRLRLLPKAQETQETRETQETQGRTPGAPKAPEASGAPFIPVLTCCGAKCVRTPTGGVCRECGLPWTMHGPTPVLVLPEVCPVCGLSLCIRKGESPCRKVCLRCE